MLRNDIQWIIDEGLVAIENNYVDVNGLEGIFPSYELNEIMEILYGLGYHCKFSDDGFQYLFDVAELHDNKYLIRCIGDIFTDWIYGNKIIGSIGNDTGLYEINNTELWNKLVKPRLST